ncbi:MAG TPA: HdeD family acid-resistance protein [Acidimicrobiia bacterium]|jgi:uncharacterized membrane protein HdeD (DUF308 family)
MLEIARRSWWVFLVRGLLAIVFGILALTWPQMTILALVTLFGAYVLVDGFLDIGAAITGRDASGPITAGSRILIAVVGLISVAAGLVAFFWPGMTALVLLFVIAWWAILRGVLEIAAAWRLRAELTNEWMWVLSGLLSVALGVVLIANPGVGALAVVFWIGIFAIAWGVALCVVAFRLRSAAGTTTWSAPAAG